ncbi:rRNA methyltransferase 2, mitochondrial-like [Mercenaria mercenaria]|uniref:rRNA methyltransferase 2, mitochondrial-like n=1 Tax=Mercenaria mercenaria TaxID=6596 RepID=UPI00234F54F0|nr:rRNA methyltransferase 2, mitochondrial-like [Mercenaria mercenaria]
MATSMRKLAGCSTCIYFASSRFSTSLPFRKITPNKFKGKQSSRDWVTRQLNDPYVRLANEENYRCRSAFKLTEIDDNLRIIKPGGIVIDCGAAPGSWSQVAAQRIQLKSKHDGTQKEGMVIAVDLRDIEPIDGVTVFANSDFTKSETQSKLLRMLDNRLANTVLSDMAPNASGNREHDHQVISELCLSVLKFSSQVLESGGHVVCKLWDGSEKKKLLSVMNRMFETVKTIKPDASRSDSAEIFLVGLYFKLRKK